MGSSSALAPYPALATIGTDEVGGTWLVDLEAAGIVHLTGDPTAAADLARFLVAELAVNTWSDTVLVEVGDVAAPLTRLRPDRVTTITGDPLPDLVKTAQRVDEACDRMGCDVLSGRADGRAGDTWMPTVVVASDEEVTTAGLAAFQAELVGVGRRAAVLVLLEAAADDADTSPSGCLSAAEAEPTLRIDAGGHRGRCCREGSGCRGTG